MDWSIVHVKSQGRRHDMNTGALVHVEYTDKQAALVAVKEEYC